MCIYYIYIYIRQPLGPPGCGRTSNESVNPMKASRLEGFKAARIEIFIIELKAGG